VYAVISRRHSLCPAHPIPLGVVLNLEKSTRTTSHYLSLLHCAIFVSLLLFPVRSKYCPHIFSYTVCLPASMLYSLSGCLMFRMEHGAVSRSNSNQTDKYANVKFWWRTKNEVLTAFYTNAAAFSHCSLFMICPLFVECLTVRQMSRTLTL
jgi:hypothetical protein